MVPTLVENSKFFRVLVLYNYHSYIPKNYNFPFGVLLKNISTNAAGVLNVGMVPTNVITALNDGSYMATIYKNVGMVPTNVITALNDGSYMATIYKNVGMVPTNGYLHVVQSFARAILCISEVFVRMIPAFVG